MIFSLYIHCRIRTEKRGGAWCPKQQLTRGVYEYLQIDLQEIKVITLVETQGRFGNGQVGNFSWSLNISVAITNIFLGLRLYLTKPSLSFISFSFFAVVVNISKGNPVKSLLKTNRNVHRLFLYWSSICLQNRCCSWPLSKLFSHILHVCIFCK